MIKWPQIRNSEFYLNKILSVLSSDIWTIRAQKPGYYLTEEFENKWANFCGRKYALLVSSGSSALEISLRVLNIGKADEVIIPALGWYATAAAVTRVGATPIFCDVDPYTTCIDAQQIAYLVTAKTRAIIAVHLHCSFAPLMALKDLCEKHKIILLEDAAQSHGGTYLNHSPGYYSLAASFSFNQEKLIPSGEGGAIVTDDEDFYRKAYALRTDGYISCNYGEWAPSGFLGSNSAASEFQAAVLLGSLEEFSYFNKMRLENAQKAIDNLRSIEGITTILQPTEITHNFYYELGIIFSDSVLSKISLDTIIKIINEQNIVLVGRTDIPVPNNPLFSSYYHDKRHNFLFKNAEKVYNSLIVVHHKFLLQEQIQYILPNLIQNILSSISTNSINIV
ncbi:MULTISPECIES: DegT/DnrJ/EryC1/StrS family aminotransferase [spotted fever group]|uniref:L-glutamine:2-deoxy-scyllo-inosose aminotransferase n=2 Tax=Rickettsia tamurae TaxID=334545 RepID=A0A8E1C0L3_9RICK|nr:DegT/DnrJ/EryC1/StrS family aminotransferase [Rickettsia endosymbiont of Ixodes scapularis]EER22277.1 L-glutamine:2-deoxy-scyllo-inosose aminotransferase [Rickettsia endosymbiont of Ixodes scapularis]KDO03410.1 L-glutamine:2-deoxy-scyllo-inosose aminotransferase [Rickettsia tamurae subsp. buchneri]